MDLVIITRVITPIKIRKRERGSLSAVLIIQLLELIPTQHLAEDREDEEIETFVGSL